MAIYDIDLLRALFVDKLNDNTIFLASFYEQIQDEEQINRYVDTIKELLALQNREKSESNYKAMGIIAQSGNAEIINIKQNYISPLEYQARFDIELNDRDYVLGKLKTLINDLRGRKFDLALRSNGQVVVFQEPTGFNDLHSLSIITNNMYIPYNAGNPITTPSNFISELKNRIFLRPLTQNVNFNIYFVYNNVFYLTTYKHTDFSTVASNITAYNQATERKEDSISSISDTTTLNLLLQLFRSSATNRAVLRLLETSTGTYYYYAISLGTETRTSPVNLGSTPTLYKLSLSFDGIQSQEPYINNGVDRVFLFFGGSATIVESKVSLGNDIVLNTIRMGKNTGPAFIVEPTEIPASLSVSDDTFQTYTTGYQTVDRNMAIGNKMAYSFIYDNTNLLFNDLYAYARFGVSTTPFGFVLPQQIFTIKEYRYSFGVVTIDTFYAKLGDVATSNTNGDVMTISVNFKIGAYDLVVEPPEVTYDEGEGNGEGNGEGENIVLNWTYQSTGSSFDQTTNFTYPSTIVYDNASEVPLGQLANYLQTNFPVGNYIEDTIFKVVVSASIDTSNIGWQFIETTSSSPNLFDNVIVGSSDLVAQMLIDIEEEFPASQNTDSFAYYASTADNLTYIFYTPGPTSSVQFVRNEFYRAVKST